MRMHYDEQADALYLRLDDSKEVQAGIVLDFNSAQQVVGIEVLRLKERVPNADVRQLHFDVA